MLTTMNDPVYSSSDASVKFVMKANFISKGLKIVLHNVKHYIYIIQSSTVESTLSVSFLILLKKKKSFN
jgi:hypothetical protein